MSNFIGNYIGTTKEPDFAFIPLRLGGLRREFPSVILETGWASTGASLERNRRQWHEESGGKVMVVILVKLCRPNAQGRVKVTLQVSHTTPGAGSNVTKNVCSLHSVSGLDWWFTHIP